MHNLEVQRKGDMMREQEQAHDYISRKIAQRLEIERKGGLITDVAFLVAPEGSGGSPTLLQSQGQPEFGQSRVVSDICR